MVIKIAKVTIFHLGIFKFPILLIENKQKNNIPRNIEAFKSSSEKYIKIMKQVSKLLAFFDIFNLLLIFKIKFAIK